ncbi:uncharacterized protein LOC131222423 isoform X4 [Magnolia sinica]|uniref:uncharacterized protein LOC131222423 isoform X4 n=1 Tax=Magnolia sinica TaxID=86752 RepID=UPI0026586C7E|nr:uncharacterized protein LOC131222423 isoform X4 [Magnolia sinica]
MKLLLTKAPPPCFAALLSYARETMEDSKKRKLEETGNGQPSSLPSEEHLRLLLDPLRKDQLLDLLVKLCFVVQAFAGHGEIEEGAVIVDKATGKSRGYGFITYRHMESTQMALREPSKLIDGRLAVCNLACEGLSSASVTTDQAQRKLYIGGLSPDVSSEILLNFFSRHGEIEEGSVAYDKETNKSRGFGFVTYKTLEAAKKALDDPNKVLGFAASESLKTVDCIWLQGRNITVKLADSQKAKVVQTQIPATMVPIAIPLPAGYAQPGKTHVVSTAPIGYSAYPQALAAYPAAYPGITPQYPPQSQVSYAQVAAKKDPVGLPAGVVLPAGAPAGISGYPYYAAKQ